MAVAYEIGVKIAMQSNAIGVLSAMSSKILGVHADVQKLQGSFNRLHLALAGGAGIWAGSALFKGVKDVLDHSNKLVTVQERLRIAGVAQGDVARATAESYRLAAKYGLNVVETLQTMNEVRIPLGGISEAISHTKDLGAAMVVMRSLDSKRGGDSHLADQVYNLVRSAEFRNAVSGPEFSKAIDLMVRAGVASGGRVNPTEFFAFSKYARGALPSLSDRFLYSYGPELAMEFKGSSAGTALASLYKNIVGGTMTTRGARLLGQLGMINEGGAEFDKHGRIVRLKPGGIVGADKFASDPDVFAGMLIEKMKAKGLNETQQRQWLSMIFGNRSSEQMMGTLAYQRNRLDRGAVGIAETMNIGDAAKELLAHDPVANMERFHNAWSNLLTSMGNALVEPAISAMQKLARMFDMLASFAREHPEMTKAGAYGAAGGAGLLVTGGAMAVAGAALSPVMKLLRFLGGGAAGGEAGAAGAASVAGGIAGAGSRWLPRLLGRMGYAGLAIGGFSLLNSTLSDGGLVNTLGKSAAGAYWTPKSAEEVGALTTQLKELEAQIAKITRDSKIPEMAETLTAPLKLQAQELRNRIESFSNSTSSVGSSADAAKRAIEGLSGALHALGMRAQRASVSVPSIPAARPTTLNANINTHVDGQVISRTVVSQILRDSEHVRQAPHHDGWSGYVGPDAQFATA